MNINFNIDDNLIMENFEYIDEFINNNIFTEDGENIPPQEETPPIEEKIEPQKEVGRNGVLRKKLYIEFIEWAKEKNSNNNFGSNFNKNIFNEDNPFVPKDMRFFYRLADPLLCMIDDLTFFSLSELNAVNSGIIDLEKQMIFAATKEEFIVFNKEDDKIYIGKEKNKSVALVKEIANNFDDYIQDLIGKKIL